MIKLGIVSVFLVYNIYLSISTNFNPSLYIPISNYLASYQSIYYLSIYLSSHIGLSIYFEVKVNSYI